MARIPVVLAVDLGTSGPKVALVDTAGQLVASGRAHITTHHGSDGSAVQNPDEMWAAVGVAAADVWSHVERAGVDVVAVACTSQYFSTIPVDARGHAVGPCLTWMDGRGGALSSARLSPEAFGRWIERSGLFPLPSGTDGSGHVSWFATHHPDVFAAARAFVEPVDYLTARCTGRVTATAASTYGLHAVDLRHWSVTGYDAELVAAGGLDPQRLAPLIGPLEVVGPLLGDAAAMLGVGIGVPVLAGTLDSISGAVGLGASEPGAVGIVIGTTSVVVGHVDSFRTDLDHALLTVPSPVTDRYALLVENGLGGRVLDWFAQGIHGSGDVTAMERDALAVPAGADGVMFLPWLRGTIAPNPNDHARGMFLGLGLDHDHRHLARAVFEGLAANLAWVMGPVEHFVGGAVATPVHVAGGAARSPLLGQCLADALGRPVARVDRAQHVNARGAALLAWHALGVLDLAEAPAPHVVQLHEPVPDHTERVAARLAMFDRLVDANPTGVP
jgi:xylulokinase